MDVASPLWLLALLAVPAIWWLHRAAGHGQRILVPSLLAFRAAATTGGTVAPAREADPAWRRRALAAAALALALANLSIAYRSREVTVWLDDSLSMSTQEASGSRLALGMARLRTLLTREQLAGIEIRSLSNPAVSYSLDEQPPAADAQVLQPPLRSALRPEREQWLITDGASVALARWASDMPLQRIIQVGSHNANVGITAMAARASLADPARFVVEVEVYNAGPAPVARELWLWSAQQPLAQQQLHAKQRLQLAAHETRTVMFDEPLAASFWRASLNPTDSLAGDDSMVLATAALQPARIVIDAQCPRLLSLALQALPLLRRAPADEPADARVECRDAADRALTTAGAPTATARAALLLRADRNALLKRIAAVWTAAARGRLSSVAMPPLLVARGDLHPITGDVVLIQSASGALALQRGAGPYQVLTTLDFSAIPSGAQPDYALLPAQLLELALERSLLAPLSRASRDPRASDITPRRLPQVAAAPPGGFGKHQRSLTLGLLALAAALLLWDLVHSWQSRPRA